MIGVFVMPEGPHVSVVIPVRNEQDDVAELTRSLRQVLAQPHEIIFIDDGSTDATWQRLLALYERGNVRLLRFRRNFGKTAALSAGFAAAQGTLVITMDGDLQDDPKEIPRFLKELDQGADLVVGWKKQRHDPWHKVAASRLFNFVVARSTGLALHDVNCGFKAYRRQVTRDIRIYGEMHRFIPVLAAAKGYRVAEIEVAHHPRKHGRSKYGMERLLKGFLDLVTVLLITRFGDRPGHGFGWVGLVLFCVGAVAALLHLTNLHPFGFALLAAVLGLGGFISLVAGWVAEVALAQRGPAERVPVYSIEEQLD
jgi:glycosyltransferase involved in cell wall biosynthesis